MVVGSEGVSAEEGSGEGSRGVGPEIRVEVGHGNHPMVGASGAVVVISGAVGAIFGAEEATGMG